VLDLACGTGAVARIAAARVGETGRCVGLDSDPAMLAVAARTSPDLTWDEGDVASMPYDDGTFDLVTCQQGLQFFSDRPRALNEARRVLRPGGRFALVIWRAIEFCPGHGAIFAELGALLGPEKSNPTAFSLFEQAEIGRLFADAGFIDIDMRSKTLMSHYPSARQFVEWVIAGASRITRVALAEVDAHEQGAFIAAVVERLEPYEDGDSLALPMSATLLTASRD
jgi:SAM-dependent methyltransferase